MILSYIQHIILLLLSLLVLFHVMVLLKIIPYKALWGGRLSSDREMYKFELPSLLMSLLFLGVILIHSGYLLLKFPEWVMTAALSLMAALFGLNTLGNLTSKNKFERGVFSPLTLLLAFGCAYLALKG